MITEAQRKRLGIFLIAGIFLMLFFIAVPLSFKLRNKTKQYYSYFEGESLSGLGVGADVKYHGVLIGKISDITYDKNDLTKIKVVFDIKDDFPMKKDMVVQSGLMGITGMLYLEIMGGTNEAETLPENSEIPTKTSLMSTITGKAEAIITKVELLINQLNVLTNPDSLKSIKTILDNVSDLTKTAKAFVEDVKPDIKSVTTDAKKTMINATKITNDVASITGKLDESVDPVQIKKILAHVDSSTTALKNLSTNLDLTLRQSREDVAVSLENLREAMENANELTRILVENPSLILKNEQQKERKF